MIGHSIDVILATRGPIDKPEIQGEFQATDVTIGAMGYPDALKIGKIQVWDLKVIPKKIANSGTNTAPP